MSQLTALTTFMFLAVSSAWAQTPAPAPGGTPGSPPVGDAAATGGGIMDYWWMILLAVIIIAGIWYFSRGRSRTEARRPPSVTMVERLSELGR
jgi:hypothetical protein